ncbi:MAG: T9SS type A sorting domain-containing protein, partial [Bacteroidota bacterium]
SSGGVGGTVSIYQNDSGCDNVPEILQDCNGGGSIILPPGGNGQAAIFEEQPQLEIFPNPTSDRLNILLSGKLGEGELLLHDTSGRLLWRQATDEKTSEYGFEKGGLKLLPGLYLLEWRSEGGRIWRRVAVQ